MTMSGVGAELLLGWDEGVVVSFWTLCWAKKKKSGEVGW